MEEEGDPDTGEPLKFHAQAINSIGQTGLVFFVISQGLAQNTCSIKNLSKPILLKLIPKII